jgi:hypothetical protein
MGAAPIQLVDRRCVVRAGCDEGCYVLSRGGLGDDGRLQAASTAAQT